MGEESGKRVVIVDGGYESYELERAVLGEMGLSMDLFEGDYHDRAGKIAFTKGAVGAFVRWTDVDGEFLDALPTVRAVVRYGTGYDNVDLDAATARGIPVANVPSYANHSVSEHALMLMLACIRFLPLGGADRRETFLKPPREDIMELKDATVGIIGLGRIGGALCRRLAALCERVLACDPYIPDKRFASLGAMKSDLDTLLRDSHVITLHCTLTDETKRLIGPKAFEAMQQQPIFVNTSRGPVVDEQALLDALNTGKVRSAGLDVFWDEPTGSSQKDLLSHPLVVHTGHYAWYSEASMRALQRGAAAVMVQLLAGELPEDCLNRDALA
jgi:D-3-phosphoglycerate dehydrogenase